MEVEIVKEKDHIVTGEKLLEETKSWFLTFYRIKQKYMTRC